MKFWTVQKRSIVEHIMENGIYQPIFELSDYQAGDDLQELYGLFLQFFNQVNHSDLPGLIFAFLQSDGQQIFSIKDIQSFYNFIQKSKPAIMSLWNNLAKKDVVILELEYEQSFNPICIDINDFQLLMPPLMVLPPYTDEYIVNLLRELKQGVISRSVFPSGVIQAHLPNIQAENIVNVYEMFDFE